MTRSRVRRCVGPRFLCFPYQCGQTNPEVKVGLVHRARDVVMLRHGQDGHQVAALHHAVVPGLRPGLPGVGLQLVAVGAVESPAVVQVTLRAGVLWRRQRDGGGGIQM